MAVTLINGNGNPAVYASQDSDWFGALTGNRTMILAQNQNMIYNLVDDNHLEILSGVLVTKEGRRVQIDVGDSEEIVIPTGNQNVTRYFICGFVLDTDGDGKQTAAGFIQQVDSESSTITEETFKEGASTIYVSLYRIQQIGISIATVTPLLEVKYPSVHSHIGMIIHSTTLNTKAKVIAEYGGTDWMQMTGYVLRGASSGVTPNQNEADGGAETHTPTGTLSGGAVQNHTLTITEMPKHKHESVTGLTREPSLSTRFQLGSSDWGYFGEPDSDTTEVGGGQAHTHGFTQPTFTGNIMDTMDPNKNVYIWERIA